MTAPGPLASRRAWDIRHVTGTAADLHARPFTEADGRSVWVMDVLRPAIALGSAQRPSLVDEAAAVARGIDVVSRRSGGGAVWLEPAASIWIDLIIGRDDVLWSDDVGRAMWWVGEAWTAALSHLGVAQKTDGNDEGVVGSDANGEVTRSEPALQVERVGSWNASLRRALTVHRGPLVSGKWSKLVCFDGIGPGEVSLGGRKMVGVSQRRTREGARFQCVVYRRYDPAAMLAVLNEPKPAVDELAPVATVPFPPDEVVRALIAALSSAT